MSTEAQEVSIAKDIELHLTKPEDQCPAIKPVKPELPAKPQLSVITKRDLTVRPDFAQDRHSVSENSSPSPDSDGQSGPCSIESKFDSIRFTVNVMDETSDKQSEVEMNNNCLTVLPVPTVAEVKREIRLAELAIELEQARYAKRQAPQPPATQEDPKEVDCTAKQTIIEIGSKTEHRETVKSNPVTTSPTIPTKPHRFSIKKLLHKKHSSEKSSVKISDHSSTGSADNFEMNGNDRKAWKQSDFDRKNLTIVHPIDLAVSQMTTPEPIEQKPEAPPRTPKSNRPAAPARRRRQIGQLSQPKDEPPPPPPLSPPPSVSPEPCLKTNPKEQLLIGDSLDEAYYQLSHSIRDNLMIVKTKIESKFNEIKYKWSDFDVTTGVRLGSALVYEDSVVSATGKSVNLLVSNHH